MVGKKVDYGAQVGSQLLPQVKGISQHTNEDKMEQENEKRQTGVVVLAVIQALYNREEGADRGDMVQRREICFQGAWRR